MRRFARYSVISLMFLGISSGCARDTLHLIATEEAMSSADAQAQLDPGIRFFFGGQASSEPEREPGSRQ